MFSERFTMKQVLEVAIGHTTDMKVTAILYAAMAQVYANKKIANPVTAVTRGARTIPGNRKVEWRFATHRTHTLIANILGERQGEHVKAWREEALKVAETYFRNN